MYRIDADTFDLWTIPFLRHLHQFDGQVRSRPAGSRGNAGSICLPDCIKLRGLQDGYQSDGDIEEAEQRISDPYRSGTESLGERRTAFINYTYRNETTTAWTAEFITAFSTVARCLHRSPT